MTAGSPHPREMLHELVDGRLRGEERAGVEQHRAACPACRQEVEVLRATKQAAARMFAPEAPPADLVSSLRATLDDEDRQAARHVRRPWRRRPVFIYATLAAVLAAGVWVLIRPASVPADASRDYGEYRAGRLPLERLTADAAALNAFFAQRNLGFPSRVFDLGMMGYRLVGGRVHHVGREPSAFFVYQGPAGQVLLCEMYEGVPPAGAEVRLHDGISFHVHRRGHTTLVFWQEGDVACVLVSDIAPEEVVQLAFAKAMKSPAPFDSR
jgi:anti-sigma factor RsiW